MYKNFTKKRCWPIGHVQQFLLIMKITTVLIFVSLLQVSAAGLAQKVTFKQKSATLKQVFNEIYKQTGYNILWTPQLLSDAQKLDVDFRHTPLKEVLEKTLHNLPLTYTINDKTIVVLQKENSVMDRIVNFMRATDLRGKVIDSLGRPIEGASVRITPGNRGTFTNARGEFVVPNLNPGRYTVLISYVGYEEIRHEIAFSAPGPLSYNFIMKAVSANLDDVQIVSTGYQQLPKERATGSFSIVGREQLERRPVANILSKLEGVASGLMFQRTSFDEEPKLTIRGRSTIYANDEPLIVVDGFPIEGDIKSINPNDVESITVLKDAAAASIWGTRAANGVIVITSKRGKFSQKSAVEYRSQATIGNKPDLYYLPLMSPSDYIDMEKQWFADGRYDRARLGAPYEQPVLSPVISTLFDLQDGKITATQANAKIDELRTMDVRREGQDIFYQKSVQQQHQLNLRGGSESIRYFFSAGYDKIRGQETGNKSDRLTLKSDNTFRILPQLELNAAITSSWGKRYNNGMGLSGFVGTSKYGFNSFNMNHYSFLPYQRLRDDNGNAIAVPREYNESYLDYLQGKGFEDWKYRPAEELGFLDNTIKMNNLRVSTGLEYKLGSDLRVDLKYQYERQADNGRNFQSIQSFNTRHLINSATRFSVPDSAIIRTLPAGNILDNKITEISSHVFRGQLDYRKNWAEGKHSIAAIGGMEMRDIITDAHSARYYGYDDRTLSFVNVDLTRPYNPFPQAYPNSMTIESGIDLNYEQNRYVSFYANASYTLLNRYIFSASGRMDKSNLFGVNRKDRNVPLWSAGAAWNIDKEAFFHSRLINNLKLRGTYGFNGNIDKQQTAFPVASSSRHYQTGLMFASIMYPGNPFLQWEKVSQVNLAVDFGLWDNVISGSFEWFNKTGKFLMGDKTLDPSSGFGTIRSNFATMKGKGFDFELNARTGNRLRWESKLLFSYATDKVTQIDVQNDNSPFSDGTLKYIYADRQLLPVVGRPVYSIYSFKWAGLDAAGNPQLIGADGQIGNYSQIVSSLPPEKLEYNGPAQPVFFGGWSNSFTWKGFSLSTSFTYKFGYKFRRSSVNYYMLGSEASRSSWHADYAKRWQKPGDELLTNVPRADYNWDQYRDPAYLGANILVENAAHIRWKDATLSYELPARLLRNMPIKHVQFYVFVDNIGIAWRANKLGIDPDFVPLPYSVYLPMATTFTGGIKVEL